MFNILLLTVVQATIIEAERLNDNDLNPYPVTYTATAHECFPISNHMHLPNIESSILENRLGNRNSLLEKDREKKIGKRRKTKVQPIILVKITNAQS